MVEDILDKARGKTISFHERTVLYEISLQRTPKPEIEIEYNEMWAMATDEELSEWAKAELEKSRMPTFHPDEYLEYPHPIEQREFLAQAFEKRYLARKNLGMELNKK